MSLTFSFGEYTSTSAMESVALSAGLLTSYFGETGNNVTEVQYHELAMHSGSQERSTSSSGPTLKSSDSDSDYDVEVKFENSTSNENSIQSSISDDNGSEEERVILDLDSTTKQAAAMSKCSSALTRTMVTGNSLYSAEAFHLSEVSHPLYSDSCFEIEYNKSNVAGTETEPIGRNEDTDELIYMKKDGGNKPYKCSECPSAFKKLSNLKVHLRVHTGETPFRCHECAATFKSSGNLKIHMRIHTGEKPYQCPECSSTFARGCDLKKHKITHTKEKPFTCSECGASFTILSNLRRHMKIHVGDEKSYL